MSGSNGLPRDLAAAHREDDARRGVGTIKHGTLHSYANLRCRCDPCRETWNRRSNARNRAVARLIREHYEEFRAYWTEEQAAP